MRKRGLAWLTVVLVAAAVVGYIFVMRPMRWASQAESLMRKLTTAPDQDSATRLAVLLVRRRLSPAQGGRALKVLMTPRIVVRSSYRSDRPVMIAINNGFWLNSWPMRLDRTDWILPQDGTRPSRQGGAGHSNSPTPWFERVSEGTAPDGSVVGIDGPGTYSVTIRYEYTLREDHGSGAGPPVYSCTIDTPIEITVVEPEDAEQITLVSNPAVDKAMAAAVRLERLRGIGGWSTKEVGYEIRPMYRFVFTPLPENVAFRATYRDQSGTEKAFPDFLLLQRAGRTWGSFGPEWSHDFSLAQLRLEAGKYKGTIILTPDDEAAYRDAAIKTLWDGTLEFPIEFEVTRIK